MTMGWLYVPCASPADGPHKRAGAWAEWLRQIDPSGRSGGVFNPRRVAGTKTWSVHACGRAIDWFPSSRIVGDMIFARCIVDWPASDVQLVLWRQLKFGGTSGPTIVPTARTDHNDHLHIEWRP